MVAGIGSPADSLIVRGDAAGVVAAGADGDKFPAFGWGTLARCIMPPTDRVIVRGDTAVVVAAGADSDELKPRFSEGEGDGRRLPLFQSRCCGIQSDADGLISPDGELGGAG